MLAEPDGVWRQGDLGDKPSKPRCKGNCCVDQLSLCEILDAPTETWRAARVEVISDIGGQPRRGSGHD
jgi:hypothetical protein